jgi:hypothetical protein
MVGSLVTFKTTGMVWMGLPPAVLGAMLMVAL